MSEYVKVKMYKDDVIDLFIDRLKIWTTDNQTIELYKKMYNHYLEEEIFDEIELNIMNIVDNDYINCCDVIHLADKSMNESTYINSYNRDFNKLLKLYKEGIYDVSCETFEDLSPSFIEAVSDNGKAILIRY